MFVQIRGRRIDISQAMRRQVHLRILRPLRRRQEHLAQMLIWLKDLKGPRGGVDKICQVELELAARRQIIIREQDADLYRAIGRAGERLKLSIRRRIEARSR